MLNCVDGRNIRIIFLSASERWNLGDLLFPVVAKERFQRYGLEFINVGLRSFDAGDKLSVPTTSLRNISEVADQKTICIVGGGEVLSADYDTLLSFIYPSYAFLHSAIFTHLDPYSRGRLKATRNRLLCWFFRLNSNLPYPYLASSRGWQRMMLPVGGHLPRSYVRHAGHLDPIRNWRARDRRTHEKLRSNGVIASLAPDPVSVISELHSGREKKKKRIAVQISDHKLSQSLDDFVFQLQILQEMGYELVPLMLAKCPGHYDVQTLTKVANAISSFDIRSDLDIEETLDLISSCGAYIGTSLHGAIISHAYGGVVFGLSGRVPKLRSYIKTWFEGTAFEMNELSAEYVHDRLSSLDGRFFTKQRERNLELCKLVDSSFDQLVGEIFND